MTQRVFLIITSFIVLIAGCTPPKPVPFDAVDPMEIPNRLQNDVAKIETFAANGTITLESPAFVQTVGFEITLRRDDTTKVVLTGPFGIVAAVGILTKNDFQLYSTFNNTLYKGDISGSMQQIPLFNIIPMEILRNTLLGIRTIEEQMPPDSVTAGDRTYSLLYSRNNGEQDRYVYDPVPGRIASFVRRGKEGNMMWQELYSYGERQNGIPLPTRTMAKITQRDMEVSIQYDEASYNVSLPPFEFSYPDDAEVIAF